MLECPFVTIRFLNTTKYPDFIQDLYEYRWKAIIIEEVLQEVEKVFYFDSSIVFKQDSAESLQDIFNKMDTKFLKCGIREFDGTIHSIFSATHPDMLKRFNFSVEIAKSNTMHGATLLVASRNASSKIIQEWKECAMEKECMAPEGSHRACDIPKLYKNEYGNCHRYDQSVISLLLYKCSQNANDYVQSSPLISYERLGSPPP
uniref:Uncharacterized protein n=1 Tax=Panagrolaimus superbus TaxID=310955 RepID=A0A914Y0T9_9BILA